MSLKLVYFDFRGRAETIRMVLEISGEKYEDVRIPMSDWPKEKANIPSGQLPYIVNNGKVFGQSNAIASFFARKAGLYGKTPLDGLRIDEVMGLWSDQAQNLVRSRWSPTEEEKAIYRRKVLEEDLPKYFGIYETFLQDGGSSGYFVSNTLSLADINVYNMLDNLLPLKEDALQKYPLLQKLRQNVRSHPKLKVYLENRKETIY